MSSSLPPESMSDTLRRLAGYLNFSSGTSDAGDAGGMEHGLRCGSRGDPMTGPPAWLVVKDWLTETLATLQKDRSAFRDIAQATRVIPLLWSELLPAYLDFHRDLLFHQQPELLFNGFFLASRCRSDSARASGLDGERRRNRSGGHRSTGRFCRLSSGRDAGEPQMPTLSPRVCLSGAAVRQGCRRFGGPLPRRSSSWRSKRCGRPTRTFFARLRLIRSGWPSCRWIPVPTTLTIRSIVGPTITSAVGTNDRSPRTDTSIDLSLRQVTLDALLQPIARRARPGSRGIAGRGGFGAGRNDLDGVGNLRLGTRGLHERSHAGFVDETDRQSTAMPTTKIG